MKKLLLCTTVALTGFALSAPAHADGIKLDLAGHFKGYIDYLDQDTNGPDSSEQHVDILRETEIHFTGETTLDNGLTVGVHHEADLDNDLTNDAEDTFQTQKSYAYFSGYWGRVNFGKEDGADYLLEVAAPSADENYDGLRQYVNPVNYTLTSIGGHVPGRGALSYTPQVLDYADDATGYSNKLTYLTPVFAGFQFGGSYTPSVSNDLAGLPGGGINSALTGSHAFGNHAGDAAGAYGAAYEGSGRWEGQWRDFGLTAAGGYTHIELTDPAATAGFTNGERSDLVEYNGGLNVAFGPFNVGGVYTHTNDGLANNGEGRTWDLGADYTVGPFKLGASWLNNHQEEDIAASGVNAGSLRTNRYAGGVVYTYGPGMTFRGSVGYVRSVTDATGYSDVQGTDVLLGTQINF
jgi:outer membrane protein OmpU